jgi:PUA domain protein
MLRLRNRRRLRRKEAADLVAALEAQFGCAVFGPEDPVEAAEAGGIRVILVGGIALGLLSGDRVAPTVRGAIAHRPAKRFVTVDMGAVKFVYNGADVMAPGIVEADPGIAVGDLVWVRDERNRQPLAVGEALMTGPEMNAAEKGKAVKTLHHVGDDLWRLDEPA